VPWGFQSSKILSIAFWSFLIVCPIHFHFRFFLIWSSIGFSPVFSHNVILLITSGHRIFNILRRQRFIKDCSFCVIEFVTSHVSQPYNKTAFTLLLKMFNLDFILIFLFFQIRYSCTNTTFAFLMLLVTSSSAPPPPVTILPDILKIYKTIILHGCETSSLL
jgi:hypothetical protein